MNDKQYTQEMIKNLNNRLKTKQEALTFDNTPTEGSVNPVTSEGVKAYADASKGTTYTAGENITISPNNVISAIDTKYSAGDNITISEDNVISSTTDVSGTDDGTNWTSLTINSDTKAIPQGCKVEDGYSSNWIVKTWSGTRDIYADDIWTDGENIYFSNGPTGQYVLDKVTSTWLPKTWTGLTDFYGREVWTDGENIYFSYEWQQYVLDLSTSTWQPKRWKGQASRIDGSNIWTDGENTYYSDGSAQYIFNRASGWSTKTWTGLTNFYGYEVWTDGENVYYSYDSNHYVLNKNTSTWSLKTWTGLTNFYGSRIWTDGNNIYYSYSPSHYQLEFDYKELTILTKVSETGNYNDLKNKVIANPAFEGDEEKLMGLQIENIAYKTPIVKILDGGFSNKWNLQKWQGLVELWGDKIWTDGENIYYSDFFNGTGTVHYVLNKATFTWTEKTWIGLTSFDRKNIWTDGENIYYSVYSSHYVLDKSTSTWSIKTWTGLTNFYGYEVWTDGDNIYYSNSSNQFVLDKSTSTWSQKTWNGLSNFEGQYIWTDGDDIYFSHSTTHCVLDKSTSTWLSKTWSGLTSFNGLHVWTDGNSIYYSYGLNSSDQFVLDKTTSTWLSKTWEGISAFSGDYVWTDGEHVYYSGGTYHRRLEIAYHIPSVLKTVAETADYNDLKNKPVIPNEEHLYIYSIEVDNGTDTITLINIQTSELLQSILIFNDLINLIQIGSSGVGDDYATLQGSLGFVNQKSDTQFTLLTEDGTSHTFASTDTLTITSHLEKTIF